MIKKHFKKLVSIVLSVVMVIGMSTTAFASEVETTPIDPYTIEGQYVQELVNLSEDEISSLALEDASLLFEKAFSISSKNYTEDEIRLALDGLSFGLKFQNDMNKIKETATYESHNPKARSTTANKSYSGNVGVAWVRDTTKGHSPLTLGEILSGTYTLEVDYITLDTAASILSSSADYNSYKDLSELVAVGAASSVLTNKIVAILKLTGWKATVASIAVGTAVGFGWNWLKNIDRDRMYEVFNTMDKSASKKDMMKVQFMWSGNMVNKFYYKMTKTTNLPNPYPDMYGDWYTNKYGYLYSY